MSSGITPEQVAQELGLEATVLGRPCDDGSLPTLAYYVHPWRLVFANLLTEVDLADVDSENACRLEEEKRLCCLRKWKTRCGSRATFKAIIEAVLSTGSKKEAELICQYLLRRPGKRWLCSYS